MNKAQLAIYQAIAQFIFYCSSISRLLMTKIDKKKEKKLNQIVDGDHKAARIILLLF